MSDPVAKLVEAEKHYEPPTFFGEIMVRLDIIDQKIGRLQGERDQKIQVPRTDPVSRISWCFTHLSQWQGGPWICQERLGDRSIEPKFGDCDIRRAEVRA